MAEVIIYILNSVLVKENYSSILAFVDEKRRLKAERFINEKERLLSLGAGYLLKKYLPDGEIKTNDNGKPYLDNGPYFNISHSENYVVLAIDSTYEVGVDIEKIDIKKEDAIRYVLNEQEKDIDDLNTLFQIWSNKESIIKCVSTGLKDIKTVNGLPLNGVRNIEGEDYYTRSMIYEDYSLSITLKTNETINVVINRINNLENE